ncbi:hypothetical protein J43TS9_58980 [Paenibacillus cineris]|nr:hypothetical protein J43TS9_58980 [Paenibacillus cineris]
MSCCRTPGGGIAKAQEVRRKFGLYCQESRPEGAWIPEWLRIHMQEESDKDDEVKQDG